MNINTNYSVASKASAIKSFRYTLDNGKNVLCYHNKELLAVYITENTPNGERIIRGIGQYKSKGTNVFDGIYILKQLESYIGNINKFINKFAKS